LIIFCALLVHAACSFTATGLRVHESVPKSSYIAASQIIVYSCSEKHPGRVPDFHGLQQAFQEGCPDASGLARADLHLLVNQKKRFSDSDSKIHCWTLRGYPVFPSKDNAGCSKSSSLLILD
tara:strand:- start:37 stop:402 length:366 start_codon:yes stop_codon:yes gene_type:complete